MSGEDGWEFPTFADPKEIEEIIRELDEIIIVSTNIKGRLERQIEDILKLREETDELKQDIKHFKNTLNKLIS